MILWKLVAIVSIWWLANTLASVLSKCVMDAGEGDKVDGSTSSSWTAAFKDLRWLDLTALQHLVGMVASAIWLKLVMKESLVPEELPKSTLYAAALGNVAGNLATNAAYSLISSSTTQVIKACEPIFTFMLSLVLLSNRESLTMSTLMSIVTVITGACMFVVMDLSFNVWGLVAAVCSNIAFPVRNIYVKKLSQFWNNPLQKYAIISAYSVVLLLPAVCLKAVATRELFMVGRIESIFSSLSHFTYNAASIGVLQNVTPLTHAVLNLSKRVFVILVNIAYFQTPLSTSMLVGLTVFFIGVVLYYKAVGDSSVPNLSSKKAIALAISLFLVTVFIYRPHYFHGKRPFSLSAEHGISTSWVYSRPVPLSFLKNIRDLGEQNSGQSVKVYCGTSQCVDAIERLKVTNIKPEFLVIPDLVRDTPLERWVARHPLNKVLSGSEFEHHLQEAVRLGILWHHGGVYVDPSLKIMGDSNNSLTAWIGMDQYGKVSLNVSCFPRKHDFVGELSEMFVKKYYELSDKHQFDFSKIVANAHQGCKSRSTCPQLLALKFQRFESGSDHRHYGTLSYNSRVNIINGANGGDEIQGFPGLQFVPYIDHLVERDALRSSKGDDNITVFFNAWWGTKQSDWPPPQNIQPIMISVHIHSFVQDLWAKHIGYLKSKEPIGCRDYSTLDYLTKHGVEAYFSGCLTLLTKTPDIHAQRTDNIFLVDVKQEYLELLPAQVREKATRISHALKNNGGPEYDGLRRFSAGYDLIEKYSTAKLVITQRIHCALPCVAMGTPVIFINSAKLPGGGGDKKEISSRVSGLLSLFHTLDFYSLTKEEAIDWLNRFSWDDPPPNPSIDLMMRLRAAAWNVIRQDQSLYDSAHKFGLLPLPHPVQVAEQPLFHLIVNSSDLTTKMFQRQSCEGCGLSDVIFWHSVESIFHHHPLAKVIVHSSTLLQSDFAVLTEAGYSLEVQKYTLTEILKDTPAEGLTEKLDTSTQLLLLDNGVLQAAILYKWGGVYMENDIILVRPVDSLGTDVVVWKDYQNTTLSTAFMKFQQKSIYLERYLAQVSNNDLQTASTSYSDVLIAMTNEHSDDIIALNSDAFFSGTINELSSDHSKSTISDVLNVGYGVQVNNDSAGKRVVAELKKGSTLKHLLNTFCVLCNRQY